MSYLRRSYGSPNKPGDRISTQGSSQPFGSNQLQQNMVPSSPFQHMSSPVKSPYQEDLEASQHLQKQETDLWRSRCGELEDTLQQANNDLILANQRMKQNSNLEEKVDIVMKNNAQLMEQHNALQKQLLQKQTETEIWKQKYEKEINEKITQKSSNEMTINRLSEENQRMKDILDKNNIQSYKELENTKQQIENQNYTKMKTLKANHCEDIGLFEEQIRKLREIVEDREKQISILNQKLGSQKNESEIERLKLDEDKQKLHTVMSQLELENQREKELAQNRLEQQNQNQIDNLKQHYQNEIELQESEIKKLKGLLDLKTQEIKSLINQNKDQKFNNDDEESTLRNEVQELKDKIQQLNQEKLDELEALQQKLDQAHETDLQGLRFHHENQIESLEKEIGKLHEMVENKTRQIDDQIKEKLEQRQNYNQELDRLNQVVDGLKQKQAQLEQDLVTQKIDYETLLETERQNHRIEQEKHRQQNEQLEGQVKELQSLVESQQNDINAMREQHLGIQEGLQKEIQILKEQCDDWEQKYCRVCHETEIQIEELKLSLNIANNDAAEQQRKNQITIESQELELKRLKDINDTKANEVENLIQNKLQLEQEIRKLRADIDKLQDSLNIVEKSKNQELQEQRMKLEQSHQYATETMKQTFDNQANIMEQEISELNLRLQLKDKEFQGYVDKYNKMEGLIRDFVNHPEKLRDKADVATTKNLYDVLKASNRSPVKRTYSPIKRSTYY